MITCSNCSQDNADESQFCRFCGHRISAQDKQQRAADYQFAPPRPYSWKTDEYQTQAERRVPAPGPVRSPGLDGRPANAGPLAYSGPQYLATGYHCPNCGTTALPIIDRRISPAGWIVFSLLLVFTVIFFWVGLLMKQDVRICPVCRATLN